MNKPEANRDTASRSRREGERGQVLVMLALFMIALLAVVALVFDGGNMYLQRRRMQNAADAGALAGAVSLAKEEGQPAARNQAQEYARVRNGADSAAVTFGYRNVTVVACRSTAMTFAQVIGLGSTEVCARATAAWVPISGVGWLRPIAIEEFPYEFDVPYTMWDDVEDEDPTNPYDIQGAKRGWVDPSCSIPPQTTCGPAAGASDLAEWMANGYNGMTYVDSWIRGKSGVAASVIGNAEVGDIIPIVVYDSISEDGFYHIVTFAAFRITNVDRTGNDKRITGEFQHYIAPAPPGDEDDPDSGWRTVHLTE